MSGALEVDPVAGGSVNITTDSALTISSTLSSTTASNVNLTSGSLNLSGAINAGATGHVLLNAQNNGVTMSVGGAGTYNISNSDLSNITALDVTIGSTAQTGSLTIGSAVNASAFNLNLKNGSGGIAVNANVNDAGHALNLQTTSGNVTGAGTMTANGLVFNTTSGQFGTLVSPMNTKVSSFQTLGTPGANVAISNTSGGTLDIAASSAANTFQVAADNSITTSGTITAPNISLTTTANNGNIQTNKLNASTSVNLLTNGIGAVNLTGNVTSGNITVDTANLGFGTFNLISNVNGSAITMQRAGGTINISGSAGSGAKFTGAANNGTITIGSAAAGSGVTFVQGSSTTYSPDGNNALAGSVAIKAGAGGVVTWQDNGAAVGANVTVSSGSGVTVTAPTVAFGNSANLTNSQSGSNIVLNSAAINLGTGASPAAVTANVTSAGGAGVISVNLAGGVAYGLGTGTKSGVLNLHGAGGVGVTSGNAGSATSVASLFTIDSNTPLTVNASTLTNGGVIQTSGNNILAVNATNITNSAGGVIRTQNASADLNISTSGAAGVLDNSGSIIAGHNLNVTASNSLTVNNNNVATLSAGTAMDIKETGAGNTLSINNNAASTSFTAGTITLETTAANDTLNVTNNGSAINSSAGTLLITTNNQAGSNISLDGLSAYQSVGATSDISVQATNGNVNINNSVTLGAGRNNLIASGTGAGNFVDIASGKTLIVLGGKSLTVTTPNFNLHNSGVDASSTANSIVTVISPAASDLTVSNDAGTANMATAGTGYFTFLTTTSGKNVNFNGAAGGTTVSLQGGAGNVNATPTIGVGGAGNLVFGAGGKPITLTSNTNMVINGGSGTFTINSGSGVQTTGGANLTVNWNSNTINNSGNINAGAALAINGTGALAVNNSIAASTMSGGTSTTIQSTGALTVTNNGSLQSGSGNMLITGSNDVSVNNNLTISTGTGSGQSITFSSTGGGNTVTLTNSGGSVTAEGALLLQDTAGGSVTLVSSGANLLKSNTNSITLDASGGGTTTVTGAGTFTATTAGQAVNFKGSTVTFSDNKTQTVNSPAINITGDTINFNGATTGGVIDGTSNNSVFTISNFAGLQTINMSKNETLKNTGAAFNFNPVANLSFGAASSGTFAMQGGAATFTMAASKNFTQSNAGMTIQDNNNIFVNGNSTGTFTNSGVLQTTAGSAGNITLNWAGNVTSTTISADGTFTLQNLNGGVVTNNGSITSKGALNISGTNWTVANASGNTIQSTAGTLTFTNNGASPATINNGGIIEGNGAVLLQSTNAAGSLTLSSASGSGSVISDTGSLTVNSAQDLTFSGGNTETLQATTGNISASAVRNFVMSGANTFKTKDATSTVNLSVTTAAGSMTVSNVEQIANSATLNVTTPVLNLNAAQIKTTGASSNFNFKDGLAAAFTTNIQGGATSTINPGGGNVSFTVNTSGQNLAINGGAAGDILALTNAGSVTLSTAAGAGAGNINIGSGGTPLTVTSDSGLTVNLGTGTLNVVSGATLNTSAGAITVSANGGVVQVDGTLSSASNLTLQSNAALTFNNTGTVTAAGGGNLSVTGATGLTVSNTGSDTGSASATFTATTGNLALTNSGTLSSLGSITIGGSADVGVTNNGVGNITGGTSLTIQTSSAAGNLVTVDNNSANGLVASNGTLQISALTTTGAGSGIKLLSSSGAGQYKSTTGSISLNTGSTIEVGNTNTDTWNASGAVNLTAATVQFDANTTQTVSGAKPVNINSANISLGGGSNLNGAGLVTFQDQSNGLSVAVTGGAGNPNTWSATGFTFGNPSITNNKNLAFTGTAADVWNMNGGPVQMTLAGSGTFTNAVRLLSNNSIAITSNTGTFTNNGTVGSSGGAVTITEGLGTVTNNGTINSGGGNALLIQVAGGSTVNNNGTLTGGGAAADLSILTTSAGSSNINLGAASSTNAGRNLLMSTNTGDLNLAIVSGASLSSGGSSVFNPNGNMNVSLSGGGTSTLTASGNFVGATTNNSFTVNVVGSTAGLVIGSKVTGPGIPAGTTITAVGVNTITLSNKASATNPAASLVDSVGTVIAPSGTLTFANAAAPTNTLQLNGGDVAVNTSNATTVGTNVNISSGADQIWTVNGGNTLTVNGKITDQNAPANLVIRSTAGDLTLIGGTVALSGDTAIGTNLVSNVVTTGLVVGSGISGPGIPAGTTIASVGANSITLSNNATATASGVSLTESSTVFGQIVASSNNAGNTVNVSSAGNLTLGGGMSYSANSVTGGTVNFNANNDLVSAIVVNGNANHQAGNNAAVNFNTNLMTFAPNGNGIIGATGVSTVTVQGYAGQNLIVQGDTNGTTLITTGTITSATGGSINIQAQGSGNVNFHNSDAGAAADYFSLNLGQGANALAANLGQASNKFMTIETHVQISTQGTANTNAQNNTINGSLVANQPYTFSGTTLTVNGTIQGTTVTIVNPNNSLLTINSPTGGTGKIVASVGPFNIQSGGGILFTTPSGTSTLVLQDKGGNVAPGNGITVQAGTLGGGSSTTIAPGMTVQVKGAGGVGANAVSDFNFTTTKDGSFVNNGNLQVSGNSNFNYTTGGGAGSGTFTNSGGAGVQTQGNSTFTFANGATFNNASPLQTNVDLSATLGGAPAGTNITINSGGNLNLTNSSTMQVVGNAAGNKINLNTPNGDLNVSGNGIYLAGNAGSVNFTGSAGNNINFAPAASATSSIGGGLFDSSAFVFSGASTINLQGGNTIETNGAITSTTTTMTVGAGTTIQSTGAALVQLNQTNLTMNNNDAVKSGGAITVATTNTASWGTNGQIVSTGNALVNVTSKALTMGAGATISSAGAVTVGTTNNTSFGNNSTVQSTGNALVTLTDANLTFGTNGNVLSAGPITISSSAGTKFGSSSTVKTTGAALISITTTTLDLGASDNIQTAQSAGNGINIVANTGNGLTVNLNGAGTTMNTSGGNVNITTDVNNTNAGQDLTINGTVAGTSLQIGTANKGAVNLSVNNASFNNNTVVSTDNSLTAQGNTGLGVSTNLTFSKTANGTEFLFDGNGNTVLIKGTNVTIADGQSITTSNPISGKTGSNLQVTANSLTVGTGATPTIDVTGNAATFVSNGAAVMNIVTGASGAGVATIKMDTPGSFNFTPGGASGVSFTSGGAGASTLNLNGGVVVMTANGAGANGVAVGGNQTLSSDSNMTFNVNNSSFVNQGTVQSGGASVTVTTTGNESISGGGTIQNIGGAGGNVLNVSLSSTANGGAITFDTNGQNIVAPATGSKVTITSAAAGTSGTLNFNNNASVNITTDNAVTNPLTVTADNIVVNGAAGSTGTLQTTNGQEIKFVSNGNLSISGGATTSQFNAKTNGAVNGVTINYDSSTNTDIGTGHSFSVSNVTFATDSNLTIGSSTFSVAAGGGKLDVGGAGSNKTLNLVPDNSVTQIYDGGLVQAPAAGLYDITSADVQNTRAGTVNVSRSTFAAPISVDDLSVSGATGAYGQYTLNLYSNSATGITQVGGTYTASDTTFIAPAGPINLTSSNIQTLRYNSGTSTNINNTGAGAGALLITGVPGSGTVAFPNGVSSAGTTVSITSAGAVTVDTKLNLTSGGVMGITANTGDILVKGSTTIGSGGTLGLIASAGAVTINSNDKLTSTGAMTITGGGGAITINANDTLNSGGTLALNATGGDVLVNANNSLTSTGAMTFTSTTGNIVVSNNSTLTGSTFTGTANGNFDLQANSNANVKTSFSAAANNGALTLGNGTLVNYSDLANNSISLTATKGISFGDTSTAIKFSAVNTSATINNTTSGDVGTVGGAPVPLLFTNSNAGATLLSLTVPGMQPGAVNLESDYGISTASNVQSTGAMFLHVGQSAGVSIMNQNAISSGSTLTIDDKNTSGTTITGSTGIVLNNNGVTSKGSLDGTVITFNTTGLGSIEQNAIGIGAAEGVGEHILAGNIGTTLNLTIDGTQNFLAIGDASNQLKSGGNMTLLVQGPGVNAGVNIGANVGGTVVQHPNNQFDLNLQNTLKSGGPMVITLNSGNLCITCPGDRFGTLNTALSNIDAGAGNQVTLTATSGSVSGLVNTFVGNLNGLAGGPASYSGPAAGTNEYLLNNVGQAVLANDFNTADADFIFTARTSAAGSGGVALVVGAGNGQNGSIKSNFGNVVLQALDPAQQAAYTTAQQNGTAIPATDGGILQINDKTNIQSAFNTTIAGTQNVVIGNVTGLGSGVGTPLTTAGNADAKVNITAGGFVSGYVYDFTNGSQATWKNDKVCIGCDTNPNFNTVSCQMCVSMNNSNTTIQMPFQTIGSIVIDNRNPYFPGQQLAAGSKVGGGSGSGAYEPQGSAGNVRSVLLGDNVTLVSFGGSQDLNNRSINVMAPYVGPYSNGTIAGGTIIKSANAVYAGANATFGSYGGDTILDGANTVGLTYNVGGSPTQNTNKIFSIAALMPEGLEASNSIKLAGGGTGATFTDAAVPGLLGLPVITALANGEQTVTTFKTGGTITVTALGNVAGGVVSTVGSGNNITYNLGGGGSINVTIAGVVPAIASQGVSASGAGSQALINFNNGGTLLSNASGNLTGNTGLSGASQSKLIPGQGVAVRLYTEFTAPKIPLNNSGNAPGGLLMPLTSGGAFGAYAGVPLGVFPQVNTVNPTPGTLYLPQVQLAYATQQRNAISQLITYGNVQAFGGFAGNTINAPNGSLTIAMIEQAQQNGGGGVPPKTINNLMNINNNGGTVLLDPPAGFSISLGGSLINVTAPPINPTSKATVVTNGNTITNGVLVVTSASAFTLNIGISSGVVATDSTRSVTIGLSQNAQALLDNSVLKKQADNATNAYYIAGGACQPFFLEDDQDTMMVGEQGTAFKADKRTITLQQGKIVAMVGKSPIKVNTGFGDVSIAGNSAAIIQQTEGGVTRIANLSGKQTTVTVTRNGKVETLTAEAGEELCLANSDLSDEELIPVDGVDREPVKGTITIPGMKLAKNKFDQKMMVEKEKLLVCNAGSFYAAKSKINNLKKNVDSTAKPLMPGGTAKPLQKSLLEMPTVPVSMKGEDDDAMTPISFIAFQPATGANNTLKTFTTHSALVKHNGKAVIGFEHPTFLNLTEGEVMVSAEKETIVHTPHSIVKIQPNTIALISVGDKVTKVRNVWELGHGCIHQTVSSDNVAMDVQIAAGEESVTGYDQMGVAKAIQKDVVGRRIVKGYSVGSKYVQRAEVSLVSLMQSTDFLQELVNSPNPNDKALANKLIKMAAVMTQVTARHGQYLQIQGPGK